MLAPEQVLIDRWCGQCQKLLNENEGIADSLSGLASWSAEQRVTISDLEAACQRSSKSALRLVQAGELWDADILLRTALEATLKFIYLLSDGAQFAKRFHEYTAILPESGLLKQHGKAQAAFDVIVEPEGRMRLSVIEGLIMSEAEIAHTRQMVPEDIRAIEGRWGFTGLLHEIAKSELPFANRMKALLHTYSMQSRVAHADYIGVLMPRDEERLESTHKLDLHMGHAARIINDAYVHSYTRVWMIDNFLCVNTEASTASWKRFEPLDRELKGAISAYAAKAQARKSITRGGD